MHRSQHGGRHELGQNFLTHKPAINKIISLVSQTDGPILEIGAGGGALTRPLARLGRQVTALELDEHRAKKLRRSLPQVVVEQGDALWYPLTAPVIVGNVPFNLTTPILRRLLDEGAWEHAIVLTQWEVARKRAGVGGGTMMTAQAAPWFTFELCQRVPSWGFSPQPSVDAGILAIHRRETSLVPDAEQGAYTRFVRAVFTARGRSLPEVIHHAGGVSNRRARQAIQHAGVRGQRLPRDLSPAQWVGLWEYLR
ncbi:23S ribosomal RNA methyltransferase Erm [Ancrocorticia populi]|uniref:23S ribosomal RNA methyltransferase Erm n=1 Tax=Ancrocorticia populi TaxID=2175228 RepID=UPI003C6BF57C